MDAETLRRDVLANNIANAEVPGFKRSEVNFESELKKALQSERKKPALELKRTDSRHISNTETYDYRDVEPRINLDYLSTTKANGSNVDADQEFQLLVQNQMRYQLLAEAAGFEFAQVARILR
jgi:flagellar basal-body rod protein FlgB